MLFGGLAVVLWLSATLFGATRNAFWGTHSGFWEYSRRVLGVPQHLLGISATIFDNDLGVSAELFHLEMTFLL